ncbi:MULTISPECIES: hypothetical protein [unclassified Clostridioides]|nr:hypothetical protein [Clostridioides sp. ZZV14-6048]MCC0739990.1 hypothetical protein [Clostridioides sp. ZZV14-5902]
MIDIEVALIEIVSRERKWNFGLHIEPETYERVKEVDVSELLKVLNNK